MTDPRRLPAALLALALSAALAGAEAGGLSARLVDEPIRSMGQPPIWKTYGGAYLGLGAGTGRPGTFFGVYKDLLPSVVGIGISGETYLGDAGGGMEGGVRAVADLRGLMLKTGFDRSFRTGSTDFILSWNAPLRRGGLLGRGSLLRVDWIPGRANTWRIGVLIPFEPHMGRTRPRDTEVDLPPPPPPGPRRGGDASVDAALGHVRVAARWILRLTHVFWDDSREDRLLSLERTRRDIADFKERIAARDARRPHGVSLAGEVALLHGAMARAFGLAARDPRRGEQLHDLARHALLEEVVFPYNRLFGQWKRNDSLLAFGERGRERFLAAAREDGLPPSREPAVGEAFDAYLGALDDARASWLDTLGGDSRLVFLPLQLVLRPEEHDSQEEIDALVARAQGTAFTGGNRVHYMTGQRFQLELLRSIHETEDYHVLWLHDYAGVNPAGEVDRVGLLQAVDGYLEALAERVRQFDATGRLPVYMVLLDQKYYEQKGGRLFMDLLEDPLGHRLKLPAGDRELQEKAERSQAALRRAVAESRALQAEAARRGPGWLRSVVKVHVSVTNPADFSYRTSRLVSHFPIAPDTVVRDHRKIAFRDVTEADPGRGEALYAGVAVGEQYAAATWEDRAIRVTGPAILTLKDAARRYLVQNGFPEDEVPRPLRPLPRPPDYDEKVRRLEAAGATARALEVHNDRGFARKDASIVNSMLYTLMPPGSLVVVPSPLWTDPVWAGQLVGAALRGCHVYVVAPSRENATLPGFVTVARSREVFSRFFEIQEQLAPEIEAAGGRLRTGLYTREAAKDEPRARVREVAEGYRRYPFLRDDFPLPASFFDALARAPEVRTAAASPSAPSARSAPPKLHRKTQFLATRESLLALAAAGAARGPLAESLRLAAHRPLSGAEQVGLLGPGAERMAAELVRAHHALPTPVRDRSVYYLTVGSLNKDTRGQVLDGEALLVVSGDWALAAYTDFAALVGSTTWIESHAQLDELLPPVTRVKRLLSRWVRKAV